MNTNCELFGISEGIICQQVNCCGVMGAGLAKVIMDKYPQVKQAYNDYYFETTNEKNKNYKCHYDQLGSFQLVPLDQPFVSIKEQIKEPDKTKESRLMIANIYSQALYGNALKNGKVYTKADMLVNSIKTLSVTRKFPIYVPVGIGCGYGGEKWENIYQKLEELSEVCDNLYIIDTRTLIISKIEYSKDYGECYHDL